MSDKDGGQAFPDRLNHDHEDVAGWSLAGGMTLRDYFAAAALTGMAGMTVAESKAISARAEVAYVYADAMLAAGSK